MSADNEIAIVLFPNHEYRVAEIRGCPNQNDTSFIRDFYNEFEKNSFASEDDAVNFATNLAANIDTLEYGINVWSAYQNFESYKP